jgi:hypothetical protein
MASNNTDQQYGMPSQRPQQQQAPQPGGFVMDGSAPVSATPQRMGMQGAPMTPEQYQMMMARARQMQAATWRQQQQMDYMQRMQANQYRQQPPAQGNPQWEPPAMPPQQPQQQFQPQQPQQFPPQQPQFQPNPFQQDQFQQDQFQQDQFHDDRFQEYRDEPPRYRPTGYVEGSMTLGAKGDWDDGNQYDRARGWGEEETAPWDGDRAYDDRDDDDDEWNDEEVEDDEDDDEWDDENDEDEDDDDEDEWDDDDDDEDRGEGPGFSGFLVSELVGIIPIIGLVFSIAKMLSAKDNITRDYERAHMISRVIATIAIVAIMVITLFL